MRVHGSEVGVRDPLRQVDVVDQRHQDGVGIGIAQRVTVVPVSTRIDVDDRTDPSRPDDIDQMQVIAREPEDVARQHETRDVRVPRDQRARRRARRRHWFLEQHAEVGAERMRANLDMRSRWGRDDDRICRDFVDQREWVGAECLTPN